MPTNIDQIALDAATAAIDPKVLIGPRCQVKARIQVIIAEAIRVRALEDSEAYQGILQAEQDKREALDQELAACRDHANDQAAIFALLAKTLGVPEEPHQGMAERVLEAAEALAAHVENARLLAARVGDGHDPDSPEWEVAISEALSALDDAPTTSLALLKAQWCEEHAEHFMELGGNAQENGYSPEGDAVEDMAQELKDEAAELRRQAEASKAGEAAAARGASAYRAGAGVSDNPYLHDAAPHPGEMAHEWQRGWDAASRQDGDDKPGEK